MNKLFRGWLAALAFIAGPASALTLYDGAAGTLPAVQGWLPLKVGASPAQGVAGGAYRLDTTGTGVLYFGNALAGAVMLDTAAGFDLPFGLRVLSEAHTSDNRSGYSVVLIGADTSRALELAFWHDAV